MKVYKILTLFLCLTMLMLQACGNDDDDDDDSNDNADNGGNGSATLTGGDRSDIIGSWRLISIDGEAIPGEHTFTINSNGTWDSISVTDVPGFGQFTVTSKGTYQVSGDKITGTTTDVKIEPDLGFPPTVESSFSDEESTVDVSGNRMTVTSKDTTTGATSVVIYEKK